MKGCLNAYKCNSEDPPPFPIQQISICIKPCQLLIIIQYNKHCMSKLKKISGKFNRNTIFKKIKIHISSVHKLYMVGMFVPDFCLMPR